MEDRISIFENISMFDKRQQRLASASGSCESLNNSTAELARQQVHAHAKLYAVFDGHLGVDCAQYVSTHLPMHIIGELLKQTPSGASSNDKQDTLARLGDMLTHSFEAINRQFVNKAHREVGHNMTLLMTIQMRCS